MAEVEAQPVGRHQAARLLDVRAQGLAQRGVQQVGAGVVAHRARAAARRRPRARTVMPGSKPPGVDLHVVRRRGRAAGSVAVDDLGRRAVAPR